MKVCQEIDGSKRRININKNNDRNESRNIPTNKAKNFYDEKKQTYKKKNCKKAQII